MARVIPLTESEIRKNIAELEALDPEFESEDWLDLSMWRASLEIVTRRRAG